MGQTLPFPLNWLESFMPLSSPVHVASRVHRFTYAIRNIVAEARKVEATGRAVQYLNIGDPIPFGFSTPPALVEAVARAQRDGYNGYVPSPGITDAREAVAADWSRQGFPAHVDRVLITAGTSEGIELALTALVDPGDAVLVPLPTYPLYTAVLASELLPQGPVERLAAGSRTHRVAHHAPHPGAGRHRPEQSHRGGLPGHHAARAHRPGGTPWTRTAG